MTLRTPVQTRSKLPDVGTTIFTVIGQLSAQHNAINLSQGAPNFSCDPKLIAGVTRAMEAGHNQYASMTGLQPLKERIADKIATLYGTQYDPASEVLVTASASEGLYSAISGLVHPGDEVIYFERPLTATRRLSVFRGQPRLPSSSPCRILPSTG